MQTLLGKHWHHLPAAEVVELLDADVTQGLDTFEAARRQQLFGANTLTEMKGHSALTRFILQFHNPLIYILLAAVLVTASLQEWVDSGVILGVVLVNAIIGFIQESKALNALAALARVMTTEATVRRAGQQRRIPASELVPGDTVLLQSGDKVPADLRLLRVRELQVDESALTGESVPVEKLEHDLEQQTPLADRRNMAYTSTLVTYGTGIGVVTAIGDKTEIGQISQLIASAQVLATPLTRKIAHFSRLLLYVIVGMAAVTFLVGVLRGESWFDMFMAAVALAVGAIPEGLPAAMTITLAIGVARMARRNAIIRKLPAVETLGSTTIICSDKTGTLTQNQMTVQEVVAGNEWTAVSGVGYAPEGVFSREGATVDPSCNTALIECLKAGLLCNDSRLTCDADGWRVEGDPTEGALIASARKAGMTFEELDAAWPRLDTVPFESQHRYMATLHDAGAQQARPVYVKGSVESIVSRCVNAMDPTGQPVDIDTDLIHRQADAMAAKGIRVLAFARSHLPAGSTVLSHDDLQGELTFLGLQGMIDPPRAEAVAAVRVCQKAGIRVKMVTGDHARTAEAIARQIGLDGTAAQSSELAVLTGRDLSELSDAELIDVAERTAVFARVAPEQKLRLVQALQERGHVVAMTGDGVNDAAALRRADIGVAMGITGTEVAKEAADMVLTDDNFASIEAAVEEGRGVFDNLVKFITWTLPTNLGEGLVILAAVFAGVALPILPVQILWINMTTAVLLGLMLAFEPKEPGIMTRRPRDPASPILSGRLVLRICLVGTLLLIGAFGLFRWAQLTGLSDAAARTVAVNVFVIGELFYLLNCRSLTRSMFALGPFSNRWLLGGVGSMVALQLIYTYAPVMNRAFQSAPIGLVEWALIIGVGACIYGVVGVEKWLRRRSERAA
ncbi:MAG: cation-transporting P-type ATPase [Phycisphaerales bacterium JB039]